MNYDFFANKQDKITVLDFIFNSTELQVFDHYSPFGQEISQYKSTAEIISHFELEKGRQSAVTFNLWAHNFGGKARYQRVKLNPKYCNGHTYRYATEGWGLIQLYFGGLEGNTLFHSHIGHFNEAGALKSEGINKENGQVSLWNWKVIEQTSGKLKYQIHNKMSIRKIGSCGVLEGAENLSKDGVKLWGE
jgi:hypothetical protein